MPVLLDQRPEPVPLVTDEQGVLRVAGSRVTLDAIVDIFQAGATPEEIAQQYPSLALDDVCAVVTYYLRQREQVDSYLEARRAAAARIHSENEARHEPDGLRDRLLARRRVQFASVLAWAADENLNHDIVRGVLRRNPAIDIVRVQDVRLAGADDPTVLQ